MEPFSFIMLFFLILIWVTTMKILTDMKKEIKELKEYLKKYESGKTV